MFARLFSQKNDCRFAVATKAPPKTFGGRFRYAIRPRLFGLGVDRAGAFDRQGVFALGVLGDHARFGEIDGLAVADALSFEQVLSASPWSSTTNRPAWPC